MKKCKKCNKQIPQDIIIDGKKHQLHTRIFCLECSPFGKHNNRDLTKPKPDSKADIERTKLRKKIWQKEYQLKKSKSHRRKIKKIKRNSRCYNCGWHKHPEVLTFHHKNKKLKVDSISKIISRTGNWNKVKEEIDKCILLCPNCHTWKHYKEKKWFKKIAEDWWARV